MRFRPSDIRAGRAEVAGLFFCTLKENSLKVFAYNLTRVMNIIGVKALVMET